jgi:hypothetical protein
MNPLERSGCILEDNIKMDGKYDMNWIYLTQD